MNININEEDRFLLNLNKSENIRMTLEELDVLRVIVFSGKITKKELKEKILHRIDLDSILHTLLRNKFINRKKYGLALFNNVFVATEKGLEEKFLLTQLLKDYISYNFDNRNKKDMDGNLFFIKQLIDQSLKKESDFISMKLKKLLESNPNITTDEILKNIEASDEDIYQILNEIDK